VFSRPNRCAAGNIIVDYCNFVAISVSLPTQPSSFLSVPKDRRPQSALLSRNFCTARESDRPVSIDWITVGAVHYLIPGSRARSNLSTLALTTLSTTLKEAIVIAWLTFYDRVDYMCIVGLANTRPLASAFHCQSRANILRISRIPLVSLSLSLSLSQSFTGHQYFPETPLRSLSPLRPMHKAQAWRADKHTAGMYSVFYFAPAEICCSYLRFVYPEKSRNRRASPDWWTKRDIYLVSARRGSGTYVRTRRASSAHARTVSRWWQYYILERCDALFCHGGLWIRNKGPEYGGTIRW